MERKSDCENVVLSAEEKKLLKELQKHPHMKCDEQKIRPLLVMGLVSPDTDGVDAFYEPSLPELTVCQIFTISTANTRKTVFERYLFNRFGFPFW